MVAVLGMHRSGTSWLAGSLQEQGLELGSVNEQAAHNAKGNRENDEIAALHGAVLRDSGGAWDSPPRRVEWSRENRDALAGIVARMCARYPLWGFKDQRTLLVLDEWNRQVPQLERVGIFRHPNAVARSLEARSPVAPRLARRLWCTYNDHLVAEHRRRAFPLVRFDDAPGRLAGAVEAVSLGLGLAGAPAGFFDGALVRQTEAEAPVPRSCRRQWDYLVDHAI